MKDPALFERALDGVRNDAAHLVLDSLYCELFNLSNDLWGNTEASDIDWLAREIYLRFDRMRVSGWYDSLSDEEKGYWHQMARASLEALPRLMSRIEHRCRAHAQVLDALLRADQAEQRKERRR